MMSTMIKTKATSIHKPENNIYLCQSQYFTYCNKSQYCTKIQIKTLQTFFK